MDPSWAELRHFVNFLNSQLQACEDSAFCNMELVGDTLEGFRSFVVQFMILMSRVRNMEKMRSRNKLGTIAKHQMLPLEEVLEFPWVVGAICVLYNELLFDMAVN